MKLGDRPKTAIRPAMAFVSAERIAACLNALSRWDTTGIKAGAVQRVIQASLRLTAQVEQAESWSKMPKVVREACRDVLEAYAELKERA